MKEKRIELEITVPEDVQVKISENEVYVKGKLGELKKNFALKKIKKEIDGKILLSMEKPNAKEKAYLGTIAAHIKNMIKGVTEGYKYDLKIVYAHFPINVSVEGEKIIIKNFAGEKTPRCANIIGNVKINISGQIISLTGINKEEIGQTAANIEEATKTKKRDPTVFQDGIYLISRGEK